MRIKEREKIIESLIHMIMSTKYINIYKNEVSDRALIRALLEIIGQGEGKKLFKELTN